MVCLVCMEICNNQEGANKESVAFREPSRIRIMCFDQDEKVSRNVLLCISSVMLY